MPAPERGSGQTGCLSEHGVIVETLDLARGRFIDGKAKTPKSSRARSMSRRRKPLICVRGTDEAEG
jgi:hypothetical protein